MPTTAKTTAQSTPRRRETTSRLDLKTTARDPLPVVTRALSQPGARFLSLEGAQEATGVVAHPGMSPGSLERLLMAILPPARPVAPEPLHPTALPLSTAYRASQPGDERYSPGALKPLYDQGFNGDFKSRLRGRAGDTCECCGAREGDLYVHATWRGDGHKVQEPPTIKAVGRMAIAHPASDPAHLSDHMQVLCNVCHQRLDRAHLQGSAGLTMAMQGKLTAAVFEGRLAMLREVTAAALAQGGRPLGALQVGGADFMTAALLHLGLPLTARSCRALLPALGEEPAADLRAVGAAALTRLRERGLVDPQGPHLTRALVTAEPMAAA